MCLHLESLIQLESGAFSTRQYCMLACLLGEHLRAYLHLHGLLIHCCMGLTAHVNEDHLPDPVKASKAAFIFSKCC